MARMATAAAATVGIEAWVGADMLVPDTEAVVVDTEVDRQGADIGIGAWVDIAELAAAGAGRRTPRHLG